MSTPVKNVYHLMYGTILTILVFMQSGMHCGVDGVQLTLDSPALACGGLLCKDLLNTNSVKHKKNNKNAHAHTIKSNFFHTHTRTLSHFPSHNQFCNCSNNRYRIFIENRYMYIQSSCSIVYDR